MSQAEYLRPDNIPVYVYIHFDYPSDSEHFHVLAVVNNVGCMKTIETGPKNCKIIINILETFVYVEAIGK